MRSIPYIVLSLTLVPILGCGQDAAQAPKDSEMEARIRVAWAEFRERSEQALNGEATAADDPQWKYAPEFFEYYREHGDTPTGFHAGQSAFMMWGNLGAIEAIETALPQVPKESELWRGILGSIGNAYARHDRYTEYIDRLHGLEEELTDPGSRSELMLILAWNHRERQEPSEAKPYLEEVLALKAHPFDVQKAENHLYEMASLRVGQEAPDFKVETIDGQVITLSEFRGKFVLLEFWSTTCGACMPEIPHLKTLEKDLPRSEFRLIGVTQDGDLQVVREFIADRAMTWPQIQQVSEFEGEVLKQDEILERYNVFGIPRSFLIDRKGIIAAKDLRGDELEAEVRTLVSGADEGRSLRQSTEGGT